MPESMNSNDSTTGDGQALEGNPNNSHQVFDHDAPEVTRGALEEQRKAIGELLRGGLADESTQSDTDTDSNSDTDDTPKPTPKSLQELAEHTGIALEELYKLAVPDGSEEGKTHSLGDLKDAMTKVNGLELRELELEEKHSQREASLTRMQTELEDLLALVPEKFRTPELLERVSNQRTEKITRERAITLEKIPEWSDEATRQQEIAGIVEHLKDYGFPANHLATIADHRLLLYIRENWKRAERVRKTLEMVNEKFPKSTQSKPNAKGKTEQRTQTQSGPRQTESQVARVSALLRNGE